MMYYIHISPTGNETIILKNSDGITMFTAVDSTNTDYQRYLAWLAEGNEPEEWKPE